MSVAVGSALYSRLSADATLTSLGCTGVYYGVAPRSATTPFLTIQLSDGTDSHTFGQRATTRERWIVKGWTSGDSHLVAKQITERADALLDHYDLPVGGGTVMVCRRTGELPDLSESADGVVYRQSGGRYEIEVRA
jgi:hypothetical protein